MSKVSKANKEKYRIVTPQQFITGWATFLGENRPMVLVRRLRGGNYLVKEVESDIKL